MRKLFFLFLIFAPVFLNAQTSVRDLQRTTFSATRPRPQEEEERQQTRQRQPNTLNTPRQNMVPVNIDGTIIWMPRNKAPVINYAGPQPAAEQRPVYHQTMTVPAGGAVRFRRRTDLPAGTRAWPRAALGVNNIEALLSGAGVNIALFDSGVSPNAELNGKVDILDMTGADNPHDTYGHGTAIAGIMVGGGAGSKFKSVAPGARVKSYKITYEEKNLDGAFETKTNNTYIQQALRAVLEYNKLRPNNRIDIINISYGLNDQNKLLEDALAAAYNSGITIIAAVGNDSEIEAHPARYPAAYPFVIGVGAIGRAKHSSTFSNTGPGVDFAAPGEDIFAIDNNGSYIWLDGGTSYSAAYISGVAALIIQAWQQRHGGAKPGPAQVYEVLQKISMPLPGAAANKQGHGLPDAGKIPAVIGG